MMAMMKHPVETPVRRETAVGASRRQLPRIPVSEPAVKAAGCALYSVNEWLPHGSNLGGNTESLRPKILAEEAFSFSTENGFYKRQRYNVKRGLQND